MPSSRETQFKRAVSRRSNLGKIARRVYRRLAIAKLEMDRRWQDQPMISVEPTVEPARGKEMRPSHSIQHPYRTLEGPNISLCLAPDALASSNDELLPRTPIRQNPPLVATFNDSNNGGSTDGGESDARMMKVFGQGMLGYLPAPFMSDDLDLEPIATEQDSLPPPRTPEKNFRLAEFVNISRGSAKRSTERLKIDNLYRPRPKILIKSAQ
ncbi:uncharacterized protein LMH87_007639 [Akanthomyces muscarius]|uniref:Uncharacterized protein n=1 Tax=Akanthomyces muscarius TaxID=2231603 RepID=A0A9W8QKK0_AKAMU|nr:uncharacterized protein LMH87_007639 [Akanthomyces muscarius]KAJ4161609.1 hypothetical protein LMH87_007639 [Akanthomyces muscarius]